MKNAINDQFKMNPGSKEVDTHGTFKNDAAVFNMGIPTNYGTPSGPLSKLDPDDEESTFDKVKNYVRNSRLNVRTTRPNSDRTTESSRILGPTDKEIAANKLKRKKNRERQAKIDKIKAGDS